MANLQLGKFYVKLDNVTEAHELRTPPRHAPVFFSQQKQPVSERANAPSQLCTRTGSHKNARFSAIIQMRGFVSIPRERRLIHWNRTIDRRCSSRFSDKLPETPRPTNLHRHFIDTQVRFVKNSHRYYATPLSPPEGKIPDRN